MSQLTQSKSEAKSQQQATVSPTHRWRTQSLVWRMRKTRSFWPWTLCQIFSTSAFFRHAVSSDRWAASGLWTGFSDIWRNSLSVKPYRFGNRITRRVCVRVTWKITADFFQQRTYFLYQWHISFGEISRVNF